MIICSCFVVIFFFCKKGALDIKDAWRVANKESIQAKKQKFIIRIFRYCWIFLKGFFTVLMNIELLYYLAYGILAFLAINYHSFFFAFHLSFILLRYPTLRNVIRAVWEPKIQLFLTLILFILLEYYFTIFAYLKFYNYYNERCENLYMCLLETFDQTFKVIF